jgi:hypothetical protein
MKKELFSLVIDDCDVDEDVLCINILTHMLFVYSEDEKIVYNEINKQTFLTVDGSAKKRNKLYARHRD